MMKIQKQINTFTGAHTRKLNRIQIKNVALINDDDDEKMMKDIHNNHWKRKKIINNHNYQRTKIRIKRKNKIFFSIRKQKIKNGKTRECAKYQKKNTFHFDCQTVC